jgi:hypothetical protein
MLGQIKEPMKRAQALKRPMEGDVRSEKSRLP